MGPKGMPDTKTDWPADRRQQKSASTPIQDTIQSEVVGPARILLVLRGAGLSRIGALLCGMEVILTAVMNLPISLQPAI
jgi:hypothetical protein